MRSVLSPLLLAAALVGATRPANAQTPYPWSDGVRPVHPAGPGYPPGQPPAGYPPGNQPQGYPPSGWKPMPAQGQPTASARPRSSSSSSSSSSSHRDGNVGGMVVLGLYGGQWDQRGAPSDDRTAAFGLVLAGDTHLHSDEWTFHGAAKLAVGGSYGLEQQGVLQATLGWRPPVSDDHAPVLRAGLGTERWKSDRLFFTQVTLPLAELGYQYAADGVLVEAVGLGGGTLYGQFTLGNDGSRIRVDSGEIDRIDSTAQTTVRAARPTGTAGQLGGALRLRTGWLDLSAQGQRIYVRASDGGPVDLGRAMLCLNPYKLLTLCADGLLLRGKLKRDDNQRLQESTATFFGVTLGVGGIAQP